MLVTETYEYYNNQINSTIYICKNLKKLLI